MDRDRKPPSPLSLFLSLSAGVHSHCMMFVLCTFVSPPPLPLACGTIPGPAPPSQGLSEDCPSPVPTVSSFLSENRKKTFICTYRIKHGYIIMYMININQNFNLTNTCALIKQIFVNFWPHHGSTVTVIKYSSQII